MLKEKGDRGEGFGRREVEKEEKMKRRKHKRGRGGKRTDHIGKTNAYSVDWKIYLNCLWVIFSTTKEIMFCLLKLLNFIL